MFAYVESEIPSGPADLGRRLRQRLDEPAPARIQLVAGPRQVGKTRLLALARECGDRAMYVAADAPEAAVLGYWERFWSDVEPRAAADKTIVLLDEVHALPDWAAVLKSRWDRLRRHRLPVHIVCTGSSALRVTRGAGQRVTYWREEPLEVDGIIEGS